MVKLKEIASPLLFGFGMMVYIFLINYIPIAHTGIDVNAINESILIRFLIDIIGIGLPVAVIFLIAKKQNIPLAELGFNKKRLSLAFILKKSESIWITGLAQAIFLHMHFIITLNV